MRATNNWTFSLLFFHLLWCVNATAIDRTIPYFLHTANIQNAIECDNQHRTKHNARLQHLKMIETINFTRTVEVFNAKYTVYASLNHSHLSKPLLEFHPTSCKPYKRTTQSSSPHEYYALSLRKFRRKKTNHNCVCSTVLHKELTFNQR